MIHTLEWITNTAGCGGLIAMTVFTTAIVVYAATLRWFKRADREADEDQAE